jgi:coatomer subunit epsilon
MLQLCRAIPLQCRIACSHLFSLTSRRHLVFSTLGITALGLKAQYERATNDSVKESIVAQLSSLLGEGVTPSVQLTASQVFLAAGMKREALQCVHMGLTMGHISMCLQLYLQLDRIDLAKQQLSLLRQADEDSVLTQLGGVYIAMATGSSVAKDAVHTLNQLSEQYGPSIFLLNLMACALMQQGLYEQAESRLEQARQEFGATQDADTLVNLMVSYQYQGKPTTDLVNQIVSLHPSHFLSKGLETVEGAFEREAMKYRV